MVVAVLTMPEQQRSAPKRTLPTPLSREIGRRLRNLRKRMDKTQEQVADALGLDYRSVSHVERGRVDFRLARRVAWAQALGVSERELEAELGLNAPPVRSDEAMQRLAEDAEAILGPDQGEIISELVERIAPWSDSERRKLLRIIQGLPDLWPEDSSPSPTSDDDARAE